MFFCPFSLPRTVLAVRHSPLQLLLASTLSRCVFVKPPGFFFLHQNAANISSSWLPCQLSAYGVLECVTDFFSCCGGAAHTLDPLSSGGHVSDASIVLSHIRAKANMVSAAVRVCVCVCLLSAVAPEWMNLNRSSRMSRRPAGGIKSGFISSDFYFNISFYFLSARFCPLLFL